MRTHIYIYKRNYKQYFRFESLQQMGITPEF